MHAFGTTERNHHPSSSLAGAVSPAEAQEARP